MFTSKLQRNHDARLPSEVYTSLLWTRLGQTIDREVDNQ